MLQTGTPHLQLLQVAAPVKRARVTRAPSFVLADHPFACSYRNSLEVWEQASVSSRGGYFSADTGAKCAGELDK